MNPHRTRTKICGITNAEDALHAAHCGADAIGFVFVPASPRAVEAEQACAIRRQLPPMVTAAGLFMDASREAVNAVLAQVAIDLLQFHGRETPEFCASFGRPYIKTVAMAGGADLDAVARRYADAAGLLLDGHAADEMGGSGKRVALSTLSPPSNTSLVLAGGLTSDNVAAAVRSLRPWGVDVSSGVERSPGIKEPNRVASFIAEVRKADEQL